MRGLRGYILNLADGQGPQTGTVDVSAKPSAKPVNVNEPVEINLVTHRLGALTVRHQPGSASNLKADQAGHFGWDMELSPGPIDVRVTPHDPQTEYRRRFPDESAQVGKAFLTDLERLGWAGGKDGLIWDAVYGGYGTTSAASVADPFFSMGQGNWAYGGGGTGPLAGRVSVRAGIAMLAGTVFSVEMVQGLWVPVDGEPVMDPNTSSQDRWDLLCLRTDWNPASPEYGKQSFEFIKGTPSATMLLPDYPGNSGNYRRLPLWAVKMKANTSVYDSTTGYDLRRWINPTSQVVPSSLNIAIQDLPAPSLQPLVSSGSYQESRLNAGLASTNELTLSTACAWEGFCHWSGILTVATGATSMYTHVTTEGRMATADITPAVGSDFVVHPNQVLNTNPSGNSNFAFYNTWPNFTGPGLEVNSMTWPIRRIPAYGEAGTSRPWSKLRFRIQFSASATGGVNITSQNFVAKLWPVP